MKKPPIKINRHFLAGSLIQARKSLRGARQFNVEWSEGFHKGWIAALKTLMKSKHEQ